MRRGPHFWWTVAACAIAFARLAVQNSASVVLLTATIGVGTIVLFFPLWRALAVRSPVLATEGHPELLEGTHVDNPQHPSEPSSNVRRVED